ncbi:hypothetical protein IMZ48_38645 [Candidatus Bathyarchaeota archaeon]|nr:hypothetical protein [Candidatus Bathyarchaeota archaeon]
MAPNKDDRVADAVDRLIAHMIPADPHEDEEAAQEKHDYCFELVKSVLERCGVPSCPWDPCLANDARLGPSRRRSPPTSTMRPT